MTDTTPGTGIEVCGHCSSLITPLNRADTLTNGDDCCSSCVEQQSEEDCFHCSHPIPTGDVVRVQGYPYCPSCLLDNTFVCESCDTSYHNDEYAHDGLCQSCADSQEEEVDEDSEEGIPGVYGYGYRVEDNLPFLGSPKDGMYMGVELEFECVSMNRRDAANHLVSRFMMPLPGHAADKRIAVLKEDGSLARGLEIVTAPLSYPLQKVVWKELGETLGKMGGIASHNTKTCGLHIHVSRRKVLTPLHIGKLVVFLNDKGNEDFLASLARRRNNSFAKFNKKKLTDFRGEERYEVLNLTNTATVEFRLFRGTLKPETILATIDFVYSLVQYTKWCSTKELGWKDYLLWVRKEKGYPDIKRWLVEHDYHLITKEEKTNVSNSVQK